MHNEITNSITICTTKVFNISEPRISIYYEYESQIYCSICNTWEAFCSIFLRRPLYNDDVHWNLKLIEGIIKKSTQLF